MAKKDSEVGKVAVSGQHKEISVTPDESTRKSF